MYENLLSGVITWTEHENKPIYDKESICPVAVENWITPQSLDPPALKAAVKAKNDSSELTRSDRTPPVKLQAWDQTKSAPFVSLVI